MVVGVPYCAGRGGKCHCPYMFAGLLLSKALSTAYGALGSHTVSPWGGRGRGRGRGREEGRGRRGEEEGERGRGRGRREEGRGREGEGG